MKISVFYSHVLNAASQTGLPLKTVLGMVRKFGFSGLECDYSEIEKNPVEFLKTITDASLKVSCVYKFLDFGHTIDKDYIESVLKTISYVGSTKILAIPGLFSADSDKKAELDKMIEGTSWLCEMAKKFGITVTLEDFDDINAPFSTDIQLKYFMDSIPDLRYTYDTGNFYYCDVDLLSAFELLKDKIVHVHCKDRALSPIIEGESFKKTISGISMYPAPVGSGIIPISAAIDKLLAFGYDGYFTAEHFDGNNQYRYMEDSAKWLKNRLKITE